MDDALTMGAIEGIGDFDTVSHGVSRRQRASDQTLLERLPSRYCITRNAVPACSPMS
jgi:hypothetical protein